VKVRAAQHAIEQRAPFHRQRNGIGDAILIEVYADVVAAKARGTRFAFITHNIKDFSHPAANNKLPHPDIAACFSRVRSLYFITLGEALRRIQPEQFADLMIEQEWIEEPRRLTEILEAMDRQTDGSTATLERLGRSPALAPITIDTFPEAAPSPPHQPHFSVSRPALLGQNDLVAAPDRSRLYSRRAPSRRNRKGHPHTLAVCAIVADNRQKQSAAMIAEKCPQNAAIL